MGKKTKVGKERKDHYYSLAKQQGYRARSAYKLTQIGNKFNIFDNVSFVIDLCAAPGGWMQVSRQSIPMAGHVFGVDLFPIKAIKGCTSIQADITTQRCEKLLIEAMTRVGVPNKQVELVLHDGAPNVGANWTKDAYTQNDLVLKSLHLATKFLKPNGTFVTKAFRSADYTKLLYVFNQLFGKVTPTKPSSSRGVSAEIFVICSQYLAPAKISPTLFDAARVFEDVEETISTVHGDVIGKSELIASALLPANAAQATKMGGLNAALANVDKKNRGGYEKGDDFRKCSVRQLFESAMPAHVLVHHHRIEFNKDDELDRKIFDHPSTTADIKEALHDIKLVGKGDLRNILKWRLRLLKEWAKENPAPKREVQKHDALTEDERLNKLLQQEAKEKLKLLRKRRAKLRRYEERMKMATAVFEPDHEELFVSAAVAREALEGEEANEVIVDSEEENEEAAAREVSDEEDADDDVDYIQQLEEEMEEFHRARDESEALKAMQRELKKKKDTRRQKVVTQWAEEMQDFVADIQTRSHKEMIGEVGSDAEDEADIPEEFKVAPTELVSQSSGEDDDDEANDDNDSFVGEELSDSELPNIPLNDKKLRHEKRQKANARQQAREARKAEKESRMLSKLGGNVDTELKAKAEGTSTKTAIGMVRPYMVVDKSALEKPESLDEIAEIQALGKQLSKKRTRMDLIDSMYNRRAFEDAGAPLPDWFKSDDKRARTVQAPMTKELYAEFRAKLKEVAERPIRKVAEARARKKTKKNGAKDKKKRGKTYAVVGKRGGAHHFSAKDGKKGGFVKTVDRRLKKDKRSARSGGGKKPSRRH